MNKLTLFFFAITLYVFASSCSKENISGIDNNNQTDVDLNSDYYANTLFGKALAKALNNKEIREIIKEESLKKFDKDHDVLVQKIKDYKLSTNEAFLDAIADYSEVSKTDFIDAINNSPLLTVFVPTLSKFSPENWDTDTQTPIVSIRVESDILKNAPLLAFNQTDKEILLSYTKEPDIPVIVIKNNERIQLNDNKQIVEERSDLENESLMLQISDGKLSFLSKGFINNDEEPREEYSANSNLDLQSAIYVSANNNSPTVNPGVFPGLPPSMYNLKLMAHYLRYQNTYERDFIYYDIKQDTDTGKFNNSYSEAICGFYINNPNTETYLAQHNSDWTEGNLEIFITTIFINKNGVGSTLRQGFTCNKTDLFFIKNGQKHTLFYRIPPIEITPWRLQDYGDTWKFSIEEYNPGTTKKITTDITSHYSNNVKVDIGIPEIDGLKITAGYGSGGYTTSHTVIELTTTINSAPLGEALLSFYDPIVVGGRAFITSNPWADWVWDPPYYQLRGSNTGMISLLVTPIKRGGYSVTDPAQGWNIINSY
ncbi:hypothetical protein [Parapedobacter koreensis]|uniref:Uncharacterized protein n=1 Tax=Parapedobacter koreensis TaxID=332977 RepID=A0A1H7P8V8_9SPHI|nr:hypothetical protein [Parapedobacter koreensis]SEL32076.1 hypothetical protein SAMN05421740_104256 [Parapedobacter koreensis]